MKKVLFIAVAAIATLAFSSCKKVCTCTEKVTGVEETFDLSEQDLYDNCGDLEDAMNDMGMGLVDFKCK